MKCVFQNVRSIGKPELRAALLRGLGRAKFDIVAFAETFASPDDEPGHLGKGLAERPRPQNLLMSDESAHSDGTGHP